MAVHKVSTEIQMYGLVNNVKVVVDVYKEYLDWVQVVLKDSVLDHREQLLDLMEIVFRVSVLDHKEHLVNLILVVFKAKELVRKELFNLVQQ